VRVLKSAAKVREWREKSETLLKKIIRIQGKGSRLRFNNILRIPASWKLVG
jgi:hypothetical protein